MHDYQHHGQRFPSMHVWVVLIHSRLRIPEEASNLIFQSVLSSEIQRKSHGSSVNFFTKPKCSIWFPNIIGLPNIIQEKNIKYPLYLKEGRHYIYCLLCSKRFTSIILFNPHPLCSMHQYPNFTDKTQVSEKLSNLHTS